MGNGHCLQIGICNQPSSHSSESSVRNGKENPWEFNNITWCNLIKPYKINFYIRSKRSSLGCACNKDSKRDVSTFLVSSPLRWIVKERGIWPLGTCSANSWIFAYRTVINIKYVDTTEKKNDSKKFHSWKKNLKKHSALGVYYGKSWFWNCQIYKYYLWESPSNVIRVKLKI